MASAALARAMSSAPSHCQKGRCGWRPISAESNTVDGNGSSAVCGSNASRRARSRPVHAASARPSSSDAAAGGRPQSSHRVQRQGLADAVAAEHRDELAAPRFERERTDQRAAIHGDVEAGTRQSAAHRRRSGLQPLVLPWPDLAAACRPKASIRGSSARARAAGARPRPTVRPPRPTGDSRPSRAAAAAGGGTRVVGGVTPDPAPRIAPRWRAVSRAGPGATRLARSAGWSARRAGSARGGSRSNRRSRPRARSRPDLRRAAAGASRPSGIRRPPRGGRRAPCPCAIRSSCRKRDSRGRSRFPCTARRGRMAGRYRPSSQAPSNSDCAGHFRPRPGAARLPPAASGRSARGPEAIGPATAWDDVSAPSLDGCTLQLPCSTSASTASASSYVDTGKRAASPPVARPRRQSRRMADADSGIRVEAPGDRAGPARLRRQRAARAFYDPAARARHGGTRWRRSSIARAHVVGLSMGGAVAIEFALRKPAGCPVAGARQHGAGVHVDQLAAPAHGLAARAACARTGRQGRRARVRQGHVSGAQPGPAAQAVHPGCEPYEPLGLSRDAAHADALERGIEARPRSTRRRS